jgi:hypothetical protein
MEGNAFNTIIELINTQLEVLSNNGYKIYDAENLDCCISKIRYDREDDLIKADFIEESEGNING